MKKTTILFLGLALISLNSFAAEEKFDNFLDSQESPAVVMREEVANDLQKEDNHFLGKVEEMQKNIRLMQLELKEKELKYKVEEQDKKMDNLLNPPAESEDSKETSISTASVFGQFPTSMQGLQPSVAKEDSFTKTKVAEKEEVVLAAPIYVTSIKGVGKKLVAFVESDDIGGSMVSVGDTMNNGYLVKNISKNTVTFETAGGNIEVVGLTFRR